MAELSTIRNGLTGSLADLLKGDIQPGQSIGYETAKALFEFHPLGAKLSKLPVEMAMAQDREISIPGSPEAAVRKRFEEVWLEIGADAAIEMVATWTRPSRSIRSRSPTSTSTLTASIR